MAHSDPYLASLEQRMAIAKLHALELACLAELLAVSDLDRTTRARLEIQIKHGMALVRKLAPNETPVLDDAIAKTSGEERRGQLVVAREHVRDSLATLHAFLDAGVTGRRRWRFPVIMLACAAAALGLDLLVRWWLL